MRQPVLFLDSGIGGLPYAKYFIDNNPAETVLYAADREHYPYGPRSREEIAAILSGLFARLRERYRPRLAVLACNTASVSALSLLRERFPEIPWVGTVPAVKPAIERSRSGHIGVLGTRRTIEDPYIDELAARSGKTCAISRIAAPELVDFVERGGDRAAPEEQLRMVEPYTAEFRRRGADGIVLGCTHFILLLHSFTAAASPGIGIYDSVEGVCRRAAAILRESPPREGGEEPGAGNRESGGARILLTGNSPPEPIWAERAAALGFSLAVESSGGSP